MAKFFVELDKLQMQKISTLDRLAEDDRGESSNKQVLEQQLDNINRQKNKLLEKLISQYSESRILSPVDRYLNVDYTTDFALAVEADTEDMEKNYSMQRRNLRFLESKNKLFDALEAPILFAVGARHLIGKDGLLDLLPKAGFKLTRITPSCEFADFTYQYPRFLQAFSLNQSKTSANLILKCYEIALAANRHQSPEFQKAYDQRFALVPVTAFKPRRF